MRSQGLWGKQRQRITCSRIRRIHNRVCSIRSPVYFSIKFYNMGKCLYKHYFCTKEPGTSMLKWTQELLYRSRNQKYFPIIRSSLDTRKACPGHLSDRHCQKSRQSSGNTPCTDPHAGKRSRYVSGNRRYCQGKRGRNGSCYRNDS